MQYLRSFKPANADDELDFVMSIRSYQLDMACYSYNNAYPFHVFPHKISGKLELAPITVFYGGNGSGKSTLLNVIAEKLRLKRSAPFNDTPLMEKYLDYCEYEFCDGVRGLPSQSEIITSDGVFDFLLDVRAINRGVGRERDAIFEEYTATKRECMEKGWQIKSLSEYEELKRRNEVRGRTRSSYTAKRLSSVELEGKSNGESAYIYFTQHIKENALYLLDEPENSLSARLQRDLAVFLEEAVRFYGCQLIISTHSPFILSMKGARIYDLDSTPIVERRWSELENVVAYYELFKSRQKEFEHTEGKNR